MQDLTLLYAILGFSSSALAEVKPIDEIKIKNSVINKLSVS
jgi:hypothetical protein